MTQTAPESPAASRSESGPQGGALPPSLKPDKALAAGSLDERLDAMEALQRELLAGIERMLAMLEGFAERAEPLLQRVEKRGTNPFARKPTGGGR